MALSQLKLTVYGSNGNGFTPVMISFPTGNIVLREIEPTIYQGTICNTAIQLLPTGLNVNSPQYYVAEEIGDLVDLINGV